MSACLWAGDAYFIRLKPSHAAPNPSNTLPTAYNANNPIRPCWINCKFSALKAEKVVKPPQIPVAKNNLQLVSKEGLRRETAITNPMINEPMMFTSKVANGKWLFFIQRAVNDRSILPAAPPKPTSRRFFSNGFYFKCFGVVLSNPKVICVAFLRKHSLNSLDEINCFKACSIFSCNFMSLLS